MGIVVESPTVDTTSVFVLDSVPSTVLKFVVGPGALTKVLFIGYL